MSFKKKPISLRLLLVSLAFAGIVSNGSFVNPEPVAPDTCKVNSIHDGDTMRLTCDGRKIKLRLYCIDAAEMEQQHWGEQARDYLRAITPDVVRIHQVDRDDYGRIVAEVFDGDKNLNLTLVREGYASVYAYYCKLPGYFSAEKEAKMSKLGIWSKPGLQQTPWLWRKKKQAN